MLHTYYAIEGITNPGVLPHFSLLGCGRKVKNAQEYLATSEKCAWAGIDPNAVMNHK
jgi:hypothetical protein